jgi:RNA polymerase sigma factor (sigma-70 family)
MAPRARWTPAVTLEQLSDEELVERSRRDPGAAAACLEILYRRFYPKVAAWCLRISGDRETAADVAQEVFLRVHSRLHSFRGDSRFSTWLYQVTRSVAINQGQHAARRRAASLDDEGMPEVPDPQPGVEEALGEGQIQEALRQAMGRDLDPLEARVLYLHFAQGLTLPRITELLALDNKSGAKAYVVSGLRKLKGRFGRWAVRQSAGLDAGLGRPR